MKQLLHVQNLVKLYPNGDGVNNIEISIEHGEIVGFLGANGAGKTTTLRCIAGLYKPQNGSIKIDGYHLDEKQSQGKIAFIPDSPSLYPMLTVAEHLQFKAKAYRIPKSDLKAKIMYALQEVNLEQYADRPTGNLSRGQKQRVMLAAAVIQDADLYLFDEPTVGLDIPSKEWLADWLRRSRDRRKGIIISSHSLEFVMETAQRIILIKSGRLIGEKKVPITELDRGPWRSDVIKELGGKFEE
ncbi:ABC transporter ATP-binding protein [Paenibacillus sp. MCAF9]|uniref:ABC transporter ATP-binding protein n=1 Tax=unclassified Paenibacillus TaxID=185978 RepID=UPI003F9B5D0A